MRLPTRNPTLFPHVPPIFPTVGAHAPYMVLSNHGGWADDMGKGEIGGTGRQIPGSTPQLSVGCLDLHHGVVRTRESITILTCHRHEHKISQGLSACRTSCVCQLDYFAQWPRLPGMIPPGLFMRLRRCVKAILIKTLDSRERGKSSIWRGDSGGCGSVGPHIQYSVSQKVMQFVISNCVT